MSKKCDIGKILDKKGINKAALGRAIGMTRQGIEYHTKGDGEINPLIEEKILKFIGENKIEEPIVEYNDEITKLKARILDIQDKLDEVIKINEELRAENEKLKTDNNKLRVGGALINSKGVTGSVK